VRYHVETGGRVYEVACRAFAPGRSAPAYRRAREQVVATGRLRPVGWAPELEAVFWTFPNDRKLRLRAVSELPVLLGPGLRALRLVAYAPEKSATLRCDGDDGAIAFAKLYAGDEAERTLLLHRRLIAARVAVPRPLRRRPRTVSSSSRRFSAVRSPRSPGRTSSGVIGSSAPPSHACTSCLHRRRALPQARARPRARRGRARRPRATRRSQRRT
jgi:hypothetical protein